MIKEWGYPCRSCSYPVFISAHKCPPVHVCRDLDNPGEDRWDIRAPTAREAATILAEKIDDLSEAKDERTIDVRSEDGRIETFTVVRIPQGKYSVRSVGNVAN